MLRRPGLALFAMVFGAYAYFHQAGGWNQNSRFDLVRAVVEDGSLRIDRFHRNTGDKSCRGPAGRCVKAGKNDHYYSDKAPGVSMLAVPAYAVTRWLAPEQKGPGGHERAAHAATVWAIAAPCALAVVMLFGLLGALGASVPVRVAVTLGYGLATLAFPYATLFYGHQLCAAALLGSFAALVRARERGELTRGWALAAGFMAGMAVVVEYPAALGVIPMAVYAWFCIRPRKALAWAVVGLAVPGILCAVYHWAAFGGPLTLPYEFSTQPHRSQGFFMGLGAPDGPALHGILLSRYRGLFYSAAWLLLAVPGAVAVWRGRRRRAEGLVCVSVVVLFVWLNSSLVDWQGGWALGPRYLIPAIPFLAILVGGLGGPGFGRLPRWGQGLAAAGFAVLVVRSAALMVVGTAVKPEVPTHIKQPFADYLWPAWSQDRVAVNTQSVDSPSGRGTTRWAYNLGQAWFGLRGRWSLAPLGVWLLAGFAWLVWSLRVAGGAVHVADTPARGSPHGQEHG